MRFPMVSGAEQLAELVADLGFLPFFPCGIPGWSLEECCDPARWFTAETGPWEWKGELAREKRVVYGKFIHGRAAFVSPACFPDLCNFRRDGYDWEGYREDGLAPHRDALLMDAVLREGPVLSRRVRRSCGFSKGYDASLTRLQMETFVIPRDFVYDIDRQGRPYGWGNALLDTPERFLGEDAVGAASGFTPRESCERIVRRLRGRMPDVTEEAFRRALRA